MKFPPTADVPGYISVPSAAPEVVTVTFKSDGESFVDSTIVVLSGTTVIVNGVSVILIIELVATIVPLTPVTRKFTTKVSSVSVLKSCLAITSNDPIP